mmetsp:Transcript_11171/g.16755  ORF Transcript_11171/g.16755 Transcript_11171/m.16755 type:complete len:419 (-) Transcript_11171:35-1291(-)|eukprot:CAMPEP_0196820192 /NCGR_PEP_ID=MMETSP1362-20130617/74127_1 /TAXON_ID=163516 /ORGANISM="Leptocylindrus danicus, Strain CCMP1856" /LENGTH=418 /DNA_ID=CAMNT_0042198973 /DNA_START=51 /DNA_END=1307 /DNA_ORIENTATION=+
MNNSSHEQQAAAAYNSSSSSGGSSCTALTDNRCNSISNAAGGKRKLDQVQPAAAASSVTVGVPTCAVAAYYQNFPHQEAAEEAAETEPANLTTTTTTIHNMSWSSRAVSNSTIGTNDTAQTHHTVLDWKPTTRLTGISSGFLGQDLVRPNAPPSTTTSSCAKTSTTLYKSNSAGSGCSLRMKPNSYTRFMDYKRSSRRVSNAALSASSDAVSNTTTGSKRNKVFTMKPNSNFGTSNRSVASAPVPASTKTTTLTPASVTVTMQPNQYKDRSRTTTGGSGNGGFSSLSRRRCRQIVDPNNDVTANDDGADVLQTTCATTLQPNTNAVFRNALMEHNRVARNEDAFYCSGELNYVLNTRCLDVPRDITVHVNFKEQDDDDDTDDDNCNDYHHPPHEKPTNYIYLFSKAGNHSSNTLGSEL